MRLGVGRDGEVMDRTAFGYATQSPGVLYLAVDETRGESAL